MTEKEKRCRRCAFTGHRPEKLNATEESIRELLYCEIMASYIDGFRVFISGMARGVDMWAADIVLSLRENIEDMKLMCAVPYKGVERSWSEKDRREFERIIKSADHVVYVSKSYCPDCFHKRNWWMVDHAARIIAVWNGNPSGTQNTVVYAQRRGIDAAIHYICHNCDGETERFLLK